MVGGGPGRVRAELAAVFRRWAGTGLLHISDADRAAVHFSRLGRPRTRRARAAPCA
ncbi:TetR/AcrR family transcriptional regulator C-terminal domain-containing protein [Streptomyces cyaneofuscatus]